MGKKQPLFYPPPYQDSAAYGRLILRDGSTASIHIAAPKDQEALRDLEGRQRRSGQQDQQLHLFQLERSDEGGEAADAPRLIAEHHDR